MDGLTGAGLQCLEFIDQFNAIKDCAEWDEERMAEEKKTEIEIKIEIEVEVEINRKIKKEEEERLKERKNEFKKFIKTK